MTRGASLPVVLCVLTVAAIVTLRGQQPRDAAPAVVTATSSIAGVVTNDETPPRAVRRAIVTVSGAGSENANPTSTVTGDDGTFAFAGLAAGRYTVAVSKAGYVNGAYGAMRPGRPGTAIQLAAGTRATANITLTRGAAVSGTIRDMNGEPVPAARVSLLRYVIQAQSGERVLEPQGPGTATDDRGMYRIYGVTPGEYYAMLDSPFMLPGELRQTTEQSMQAAMQLLRAPATGATPASSLPPQPRTIGYAPIYFPAATAPEAAELLRLSAGEERSGVDIQFQMVPTARIEGVVLGPDGAPVTTPPQVSILGGGTASGSFMGMFSAMFGGGRPSTGGRFSLSGIAPGHYTLAARTGGPGRGGPASAEPAMWATAEVDVNGMDVTGVVLRLEPGMRLSGRLVFQGTTAPPQPSVVRVSLTPVLSGNSVSVVVPPVRADETGRFVLEGITPGRYRWNVTGPSAVGPWTFKSAVTGGRDTLDSGLDVRPGDPVTDAVLTFSDRPTLLRGTLVDLSGKPAADYFVVMYAKDRTLQAPPSRRVAMTRPGTDGTFSFMSLPPGEYLIAALTDVDQGEWRDPSFLAQLVPASISVTLAEGETKVQEIRINR